MFKLIKILNSGVNVPEPELLPCDFSFDVDAGCCVIFDHVRHLISVGDQTEPPTHILIQNAKKDDKTILCYRISPDMIFETPLIGSPAAIHAGMTVEFALKDALTAYAASDIAGGPAVIYSLEGATKSGDTILVTLKTPSDI